jgi:hypothetical protein
MSHAFEAAETFLAGAEADDLDRVICIELIRGYARHYSGSGWKATGIEVPYSLKGIRPHGDGWRNTSKYLLVGKCDLLAKNPSLYPDKEFLFDRKTTTSDLSPQSDYWGRLGIENQINTYWLACSLLGKNIGGFVWDVTRKPDIRPKDLTKAAIKEIATNGLYQGMEVSQETRGAVAGGEIIKETMELYGLRLRGHIAENPDRYYARKMIFRNLEDLALYAEELNAIIKDIGRAVKEKRFYKNTDSCFAYHHACEYLPLCNAGMSEVPQDDERYVSRELNEKSFSHSKIQCYMTCRKKYYWRYVKGIERRREDKAEALRFGSLFHEAMEHYWEQTREEGE